MQNTDNKGLKVKNCENCKKEFTTGRNRHSCKRCLKIVCSDCSRDRIRIVTMKDAPMHKACPPCTKESVFQSDFRITYRSSWGIDSKCGESWMSKIRSNSKVFSSQDSYQNILEAACNAPDDVPGWGDIEKDVDNGRVDNESFNFSLQEFLFFNQEKVSQDPAAIQEAVKNVLKAFCYKNQSIGYCQEESAYWALTYIVKFIMPKNFLVKQGNIPTMGIQIEKEILIKLAMIHLELDEVQAKKLRIWLNIHSPVFLSSLGITYYNYECLFVLFNNMFIEDSFDPFRKGFLRMVKLTSELLFSNPAYVPSSFQLIVAKFVPASEISSSLLKTPVDSKLVDQISQKSQDEISSSFDKVNKAYKESLGHIGLCSVADMASITQDYMQHLVDEKKNLKEDPFLDFTLFSTLIRQSLSKEETRKAFLKMIDLQQIFNVFDIDKDGRLNFFEFITSFAIIIEGNMLNKLKFIYVLYDVNQKGYLDSITYERFLNHIVNTAVIFNNGGYQAFFNDDCDRFFQTFRNHENLKNPEKVKFSEIGEYLSKSPFILTHCREKKKKTSMLKQRSTIDGTSTNSENPFNLPEHLLQSAAALGSQVIEESKEEQDESVKSSSSESDNEEEKAPEDVIPPPVDEDHTTPEKEESHEPTEKVSDEKKTIYIEHLDTKSAISAWAEREKAAQEQLRARTSVVSRPSIIRSRTSIVEKPLVYENPMAPCPSDQTDDKPEMSFPYKPNINGHLHSSIEHNEELVNPGPIICRIDYVTPAPNDNNHEVSFLESFAFKRDNAVTPQGPAEKTPSGNKIEKGVVVVPVPVTVVETRSSVQDTSRSVEEPGPIVQVDPKIEQKNDFLNEDALNRRQTSDAEKQSRRERAAIDAREAQQGNCKVCNIF